jgi:hypothetical protein
MSAQPAVLLLAYKFPPYNRVGARRWAKFAKYFALSGFPVHVITSHWRNASTRTTWYQDIAGKEAIHVTRFSTPLDRVEKFSSKLFFRLKFGFGRLFLWTDEAYLFYASNLANICAYIKRNHIKILIATGAPFSTNYFAATIKRKFPHLKLIQDFRDLWTEEFYLEYPTIKKGSRMQRKIFRMEKESLSASDVVVSVTPGYLQRLKTKAMSYGLTLPRYELIENGFDPDDSILFNASDRPGLFKQDQLNICHFGTMDAGRDTEFQKFLLDSSRNLREKAAAIKFHFFCHFNEETKKAINTSPAGELVAFHDFVSPGEVQKFMFFADLHLVINDSVFFYAYGSKVYDAFMYTKPVLLISKREGLYDLVSDNSLGLATDNSSEQNKAVCDKLMFNSEKMKSHVYFNVNYDLGQHSLPVLAAQYMNLIRQLA